jgi:hypothetical protein
VHRPLGRIRQARAAHSSSSVKLPGDFLDEIADEIEASRRHLVGQAAKVSALSELQRAAAAVAARSRRRPG